MAEKDQKIFDNTINALINSAASDVINEMFDEIDTSINDDKIVFSDKHIKEINKVLSSERHAAEKFKYHKINKRILLVAIIVMTIILVTAFSVGADRLKFLNYFMNIGKHETEFRSDDIIFNEEYYLRNVPDDNKKEIKYEVIVDYIPNNFEVDNIEYTDSNYVITYKYQDYYFSIAKSIIPESWGVDTENAKTKYVNINGNKAFLSIKPNIIALCWINNNSLYMIDGNIDEETLITIAKNLE